MPLLEIVDFSLEITTDRGAAQVLAGITLTVERGETVGLVGESGCGKSVTGLSVMRLLSSPPARVIGGDIRLDGESMLSLSENQMRQLRGRRMAMIFQDPMVSLNPVMTVGDQIAEAITQHQTGTVTATLVTDALHAVGIGDAVRRAQSFPHEFSGGMRQRAMIAMMLACKPDLLIADEPTTALDVTVQAQILDLIRNIQMTSGMGVLLITHNLGVVAEVCDRVAVMYAGCIVETAATPDLFALPQHPYTRALLGAIPRADADSDNLAVIEGTVPDLTRPPTGCRFNARCARASNICRAERPKPLQVGPAHEVACHHPGHAS